MHKALNLRDDMNKLYITRKEEGRRHASVEYSMGAATHELEEYINKSKKRISARANNSKIEMTPGQTEKLWIVKPRKQK